ncbi:tRNA pseudouridine(38-40) synthase TruA [Fulvivirga lutea]|uniref:tRNA pseudouridine synthase A n=1 Tax=Fulvivirga lutea TaxID=2810512 RepID=A0A974WIL9_9BACT|nr:tRNA pseudouridine(38-40) synthase TruA [Fulvivirga lutea]QSE97832.1 tRNA pseudouridine(38-40) synthase TruA [Fulvivirga lutea]
MNPFLSKHFYLLRFQFLGFRYHGWQKQPGLKTVQGMIERTTRFVLGEDVKFKTLGASRTDAMVSARDFPMELFTYQELSTNFLEELNKNLPADIHALSIDQVNSKFNVIKDVSSKEYHYQFTFNTTKNPFDAHLVTYVHQTLDIDLMKSAAELFLGEHNFAGFCYPYEQVDKIRTIHSCKIDFDEERGLYIFKVISKGFMRYQVRLMIGVLFDIGREKLETSVLSEALKPGSSIKFDNRAPASGLILHRVNY